MADLWLLNKKQPQPRLRTSDLSLTGTAFLFNQLLLLSPFSASPAVGTFLNKILSSDENICFYLKNNNKKKRFLKENEISWFDSRPPPVQKALPV